MWNKHLWNYDYSHAEKKIMSNYYKHQQWADKLFESYKHSYSPAKHGLTGRTVTDSLSYYWPKRSSKALTMRWGTWQRKPESFLTNTRANSPRIEKYKQAAKQLGTSVIIKKDATTMQGQPLPDHVAVYIADITKKSEWWKIVCKDTFARIRETLGNPTDNPMQDNGDYFVTDAPKPCNCEINMLMRDGCQCGGV